jgi:hypothetical protein
MTRFTVVWDRQVESQFINDWIDGDSQTRSILTAIANWIDATLAEDPELKGRAYAGSWARILVVPLGPPSIRITVAYDVIPEDRQVRVIRLTIRGA